MRACVFLLINRPWINSSPPLCSAVLYRVLVQVLVPGLLTPPGFSRMRRLYQDISDVSSRWDNSARKKQSLHRPIRALHAVLLGGLYKCISCYNCYSVSAVTLSPPCPIAHLVHPSEWLFSWGCAYCPVVFPVLTGHDTPAHLDALKLLLLQLLPNGPSTSPAATHTHETELPGTLMFTASKSQRDKLVCEHRPVYVEYVAEGKNRPCPQWPLTLSGS